MIGTFGPVTFTSSTNRVRTFNGLQRQKGYRFAQHNVVAGKPKLEAIAPDLDVVSFSMRFDLGLGVIPEDEIQRLVDILDSGEAYQLVVGGEPLGLYVIESLSENRDKHDGRGLLLVASVDLQLKEYIE